MWWKLGHYKFEKYGTYVKQRNKKDAMLELKKNNANIYAKAKQAIFITNNLKEKSERKFFPSKSGATKILK